MEGHEDRTTQADPPPPVTTAGGDAAARPQSAHSARPVHAGAPSSAPVPPLLRHAGNLPILAVLGLSRAAASLGLKRRPDGWRRATGVGLRSEASKFALSAFGLDLWSDDRPPEGADAPPVERAEEHFVLRFGQFLRGETIPRINLEHDRSLTRLVVRDQVDLTLAAFGPGGELLSARPFLDSRLSTPKPREEVVHARILPALLEGYNDHRNAWDHVPPDDEDYVAPDLDGSPAAPGAARAYVRRVLGSTFVSFDSLPPGAPPDLRFLPPDFRLRRSPGYGALNVVCRLSPDRRAADVWVQVHHAATDGAPVQEMLSRLERQWGEAGPVVYPAPDAFRPHASPRPCAAPRARRSMQCVTDFIDFSPLLELRKRLEEQPDLRAAGGVTVAALLTWALGHQPEFAGKKFAVPVDCPPADGRPRGTWFAPVRPGEYFGTFRRAAAFAAYTHEFNRLLDETRLGDAPACRALDEMALLPPAVQAIALRLNADRADRTFGTVGLTILRDAKVFVAPMVDFGFNDGFIAIGNMTLPAADGGRVGPVTVKGTGDGIAGYPEAIRRAVKACGEYV